MASGKDNKTGLMSDAVVKAKTGKAWKEWFAILDKWGAGKRSHKEIAAHLYEERKLPGWWAQMVTVGYERAHGLREVHQTAEGYNAGRSLTVGVSLARLYAAWKDEKARRRWMRGSKLGVTTANPNRAIRGTWDGGKSRVEVMFYARGKGKSQVAIEHRKLANAKAVEQMKNYWGEQLARLKDLLSSQPRKRRDRQECLSQEEHRGAPLRGRGTPAYPARLRR